MAKYEVETAHSKIEELRKGRHITQAELGAYLRITQARVSHCLDNDNSDDFTVSQYLSIAEFFDVSLDELFRNEKATHERTHLTQREVCQMLYEIYKASGFEMTAVKYSAHCYASTFCEEEQYDKPFFDDGVNVLEYIGIFFPISWETHTLSDCLYAEDNGNDTGFSDIDHFLSRLKTLTDMYINGDLDSEMFEILVKGYLDKVPETVAYLKPDTKGHGLPHDTP